MDCLLIHWPFAAQKDDNHHVKIGSDGKVRLIRNNSQRRHNTDNRQYVINKDLTENPEPTWRAMERLYQSGKVRSIGVSNWTIAGLSSLLEYAIIKPVLNQIEIHPFLPNTALVNYCFAHSILPVAYSPLGSQDQVPSTGEKVFLNKSLHAIAEKNAATLATVLIAW